jgi:menaquinol-cytochrome c reductase cytochrome b subunit
MIGNISSQATQTSKHLVDWMEHRTGIVTMLEHFLYDQRQSGEPDSIL